MLRRGLAARAKTLTGIISASRFVVSKSTCLAEPGSHAARRRISTAMRRTASRLSAAMAPILTTGDSACGAMTRNGSHAGASTSGFALWAGNARRFARLGAPEPSDVRRLVPKEAGKLVVAEKSFAESMRCAGSPAPSLAARETPIGPPSQHPHLQGNPRVAEHEERPPIRATPGSRWPDPIRRLEPGRTPPFGNRVRLPPARCGASEASCQCIYLLPSISFSLYIIDCIASLCFLSPDAGSWLLQHADSLLVSYGISIASFLGGVHWGAALSGTAGPSVTARLVWGVAPSVLAFPAIAVPSPWNFALLANVLVVLAHADFYYAIKVSYANNACRLSVACSKVRRVRYATLTPALGCRTSILAASPCCVCR